MKKLIRAACKKDPRNKTLSPYSSIFCIQKKIKFQPVLLYISSSISSPMSMSFMKKKVLSCD